MCGIFAFINSGGNEQDDEKYNILTVHQHFMKLKHRGPDATRHSNIISFTSAVFLGFHRLAIIDPTARSNQPLQLQNTHLICNGEIFNYKQLTKQYNVQNQLTTGSDCEIILHVYKKIGIVRTCQELDGEFAFVLYDKDTGDVLIARDHFGIRPLFIGFDGRRICCVSSELKGLSFLDHVEPFPPASIGTYNIRTKTYTVQKYYYIPRRNPYYKPSLDDIRSKIRTILRDSIEKRLMSDVPIGCSLSGGLDSSIITSIVSEYIPNLTCFSIGLNEQSVDVIAAKKVVEYLNSKGRTIDHHIVYFTVEEGFNSLRDVIYHLESSCITTVRCGVCNYLLAKYIKENTPIRVLLTGSISDELMNGYQYGKMITDPDILEQDSRRLLNELYLYDNLRDDRVCAAFGIEVRQSFGSKYLTDFIFSIDPSYRLSNQCMEKTLLRDSFKNQQILPDEILYRRKEAFSNGIDSKTESWYQQLTRDYIEPLVSDEQLIHAHELYPNNTPKTKESYYYRTIFEELYPNRSDIVPKHWMPPVDIVGRELTDPSATILSVYEQ